MEEGSPTRKLAAVFYADVAGYSRLTGTDEEGTHRRVMDVLDYVTEIITNARGIVLRYAGDAILAEFPSVVLAVDTSAKIQTELTMRNADLPEGERVQIRIGINMGDVLEDRGEVYGEGVNLAARLEEAAEPGGICVSTTVYEQIRRKSDLTFTDGGKPSFKNIEDPVHIYRWSPIVAQTIAAKDSVTLSLPDKPSIAVLPFTNMSGDTEQEYFSDGITEDIITELSRFRSLFVVARNSSFAFRGKSVDIRDVGQNLGVRFVLEGSVRRIGSKVRITAQLIDATTTEHIWADRYDGELADVFTVQDDISRSIVSTIVGRIEDFDTDRAATKPTENLSAYENVLRGQKLVHKYTREDYDKARGCFEHAISLDPKFARARAWLAYVETFSWAWDMTPGGLDVAVRAGNAALALDDHESKSHLALGVAHLFCFEHDKAEYHLQRASKLNPNDDLIMIENGRYLMYTDEPLAGADLVRQAMRRNPYHPNWYWNILGRCLHTAKVYDEAVSAFERIRTPQFWNHAYLAACYAELGQSREAVKHSEAVLSLKSDFTISEFATALPYRNERVLQDFIAGLRRAGLPP